MAGRSKKLYKNGNLTKDQLEIRELAESDLRYFVALVAPKRLLGNCHRELLKFLMEEHENQLVIWPRGHQKSTMAAYWASWELINNPHKTILYASATAALAEAQLSFIKQILTSPIVSKYWPELLERDEGKRSMWRSQEIAVDHWKRKEEGIRDPSIKAVGMGGNITGFHSDRIILDDIVVQENAETKTEREKVKSWFSLLNSILNPGGFTKAVGTRYHPEDLYNDMLIMKADEFDNEGNVIGQKRLYTYSIEVVEENGQYLWPRAMRDDGEWFGFNDRELARIKAKYLDKAKFWAQYYNNPSDPTNKRVEEFQYYDKSKLKKTWNGWEYSGNKLNIYAAIDFAATMSKKSDYTAIVVAGIDEQHNIFILDISRFKTDKISVMQEELQKLYSKWNWIRLRAEATAQQNLVVEQIKDSNRQKGIFYNIDKVKPTTEKQIRIMSVLEPRYAAGTIFHFMGGLCETLEEEIQSTKPPHDDVSDALASCVEICIPPKRKKRNTNITPINYHPRYGGIV